MTKPNFIASMLRGKCPQCREGNIFQYRAYNLSKFQVMNKRCPHCNASLVPEPAFYQGAMYIGYGITITAMIAISAILYVLGNPMEWVYISTVIGVMLLIVPINYRYSRIFYLYLIGGLKYKPTHRG